MIKLFYLTNKCKLGISYFVTVMSFIPHMAATFFINSQINIFKETHLPSFTSEKVFFVSPTTLLYWFTSGSLGTDFILPGC